MEVDACLRDLRVAAGLDVDAGEETEEKRAELKLSDPDPQERRSEPRLDLNDHAVVADVERRLQAACAAVRVCLETHVAREEAELWPLFVKHFSASEQGRLVGLIIGRTGAEVLQSMLSWQRKALTEEERVAMLETMRDATRGNTRFESWLETWWHGEEEAAAANGGTDIEKRDRDDANLKTRDRDDVNPPRSKVWSRCRSTSRAAETDVGVAGASAARRRRGGGSGGGGQHGVHAELGRHVPHEQTAARGGGANALPRRFVGARTQAYLMQHLLAAGGSARSSGGSSRAEARTSRRRRRRRGGEENGGKRDADADVTPAAERDRRERSPGRAKAPMAFAAGEQRRGPDELVLCQPVEPVLGCKHYARKVRLVAACCGAAPVCRVCHDESEDHTIDRYATREMVCMTCGVRQPSAGSCMNCGQMMAKYFCSVCNFWDDSDDVYHCPFCNVCRRGKGLGKDFFHCMQCNSCVSLTMGPHKCVGDKAGEGKGGGGAMESDCPVCKDFLFTSDTPVKCLPCGHFMHTRCFEAYTKHHYTCPLCRKSLGDFTAYFRMLDAILAEEREREDPAVKRTMQRVACNDCGEKTLAPFHFVYHACAGVGATTRRCWEWFPVGGGGGEETGDEDE